MHCVYCGEKTLTVNSRRTSQGLRVWRRRKCRACNAIFTTGENIDMESAIRVRKNNVLKPFLSEKLFLDVYESLSHRKTAYKDAGVLTDTIISKLIPQKDGIITSDELKYAILETLKRFDKVAATYYEARH